MAPEQIKLSLISAHQYGWAALKGAKAALAYNEGRLALQTLITADPAVAVPIVGPRFGTFEAESANFEHHIPTGNLRLKSPEVAEALGGSNVIVVAGWPRLISPQLLSLLKQGGRCVVGMHPSPLPRGRGQSPVSWTILRGLTRSALVVFDLEASADSVNIRASVPIEDGENESATSLYGRTMQAHFRAAKILVDNFAADRLLDIPQDDSAIEMWPNIDVDDRVITTEMSVNEMERRIRAFAPPYDGAVLPSGARAYALLSSFSSSRFKRQTTGRSGVETVIGSDGGVVVKSMGEAEYFEVAVRMAQMSDSLLDSKLLLVGPDRPVDRRYSGVVLRNLEGRVFLQQRDNKAGIVNPGRVTLFGGVQEKNESAVDCAIRELAEELCIEVATSELEFLGCVDKLETDGSTTRCSIYLMERADPERFSLREGKAIVEGSADTLSTAENVSAVCRLSLISLPIR